MRAIAVVLCSRMLYSDLTVSAAATKRMQTRLLDLVHPPPRAQFVCLEVTAVNDEDEDVDVPTVRYRFASLPT